MKHSSHLLLMMNGMPLLLHFQMARLLVPQKSLMRCSNIWISDHPTSSKISSQTALHQDIFPPNGRTPQSILFPNQWTGTVLSKTLDQLPYLRLLVSS